jgi:predicted nucleic acid-binding protein
MKNMANKIFLDTNVVLDFLLARQGELEEIDTIIDFSREKKIDCCISESVIATAIYFLQKQKMPAMEMIRDFCSTCKILPFYTPILYNNIEIFKDVEDGLLYFLALHHKADCFITSNKPDFKKAVASLPVFTPKQFIQYYHSNDI